MAVVSLSIVGRIHKAFKDNDKAALEYLLSTEIRRGRKPVISKGETGTGKNECMWQWNEDLR